MNKLVTFFSGILILLLLSACTTTFAGTVLVIGFRDIITYVIFAFILALIIGLKSENEKKSFWIWFILNLLVTPLVGFIYLLIKISKKI